MGVPYDDVFFHDLYRKWKPIGLSNRTSDGTNIAIQMAAQISEFLRHRNQYDIIILYEDIVANPEATCRRLFEVCKIPLEFIPLALEALKSDSQKGLFAHKGPKPSAPKNDMVCADEMFAECRVPITCGMSSQEFRKLILKGTHEMPSDKNVYANIAQSNGISHGVAL